MMTDKARRNQEWKSKAIGHALRTYRDAVRAYGLDGAIANLRLRVRIERTQPSRMFACVAALALGMAREELAARGGQA